jgi:hypothetical protein
MIKRLLLILLIALLGGSGYFAYIKWKEAENLSGWSFVPETSILVYETQGIKTLVEHLDQQSSWNTLELIGEVSLVNRHINRMDSLLNQKDGFINALDKTPLLFSLHKTGKSQLDFLFVAEISDLAYRNLLTSIQQAFLEDGFHKRNRTYLGRTIVEVSKAGHSNFAYTVYKNYFIGSYSAFLVEDAIRALEESNFASFLATHPELFELIKLQKDQGNLYINIPQIRGVLEDIYPSGTAKNIGQSSFMDIRIDGQSIELDGFAFAEDNQWLDLLDGISGQSFDMSEVVSNNSSVLYHFTFDDPKKWGENYTKYLLAGQDEYISLRSDLQKELDIDVPYLYQLLEHEVGLVYQFDTDETKKILLLEVTDMPLTLKYFDGVNERYFNQTKDTVFVELYKDYRLRGFPAKDFPKALMGNLGSGFNDCFFTSYRNYLLMSNSLPALKQTLDDLEDENTWRKSLRKNNFLSRANQEASFSLYVNLPASLRYISDGLIPSWKSIFKENEYILRSFENIAIQFNQVDNKYFTNILIEQPEGTAVSELTPRSLKTITLGNKLITKPHLVKDHTSNEMPVLIQDSTFTLYWVNPQFEVDWSKDLNGPMLGNIQIVDYYKNGKTQYAFITPSALHILDREGNYISGFPKKIRGADSLQLMKLVDYDGSKDYRFALADKKGNVFLTNKEGVNLSGWNPKSLDRPLSVPPSHYRIGGKDLFLVALKKGDFHLLNRRASNYRGFPWSAEDFVSGDVHFKPGSSFSTSYVTTITENGTLQSFSLAGRTQDVSQLYKPESSTHFRLINDVTGNTFIIARQTENRIDFLNSSQELLFGKDYLPEDDLFIQYYNISPARQYVTIGNRTGQFLYIYDMTGRLVTSRPLIGNQPVSMMYYEKKDEQQIYLVHDNELTLYSINP